MEGSRYPGPAQDAFARFVRDFRPTLTRHGFSGRDGRFQRASARSIALIEFQTSDKTRAEEIIFTVNLGVYSLTIAHAYGESVPKTLTSSSCHWNERLGFLFDEPRDRWWILDYESDLSKLRRSVEEALIDVAIPKLDALGSPVALLDEFRQGRPRALSLPERLVHLLALVKATGAQELLEEVLPEIAKARSGASGRRFIDQHLARLGLDLQLESSQ